MGHDAVPHRSRFAAIRQVGRKPRGLLITLCNNWMSFSFHAYQAELYPTRIRAQAVGFVYSWSRFSSVFVGFIIAAVLRAYGTLGVFSVIALAMLVMDGKFLIRLDGVS